MSKPTSLGKTVTVSGDITADEDIHLEGNFRASKIDAGNHTIVVGQTANVEAELFAGTILVIGTVNGNLNGKILVEMRDTASVSGDIYAPKIALPARAKFKGRLTYT